jgi:type I restriction enzyme, S subunit
MTRFGHAMKKVDERIPGIDLPLMSVSQTRGVIRRSELTDAPQRAESLDAYKVCRRNDIVFNKMSIRAGAMGVAAEDGLVTYHYEVMRPREGTDPKFIAYLMKSSWFTEQLIKRERGIGAGDQANVRTTEVPFSVLKTIDAYIPEYAEQCAIAGYLDRETTRIDTLIEEQHRLIDLLHERRHSLVDGVFDTQMPNTRLHKACTDVVDCPHTTPEVEDDGAYEAVRTASVRNGKFRPGNGLPVSAETWEARNAGGAPSVGDVLFTREAPAGEACMVPNEYICLGQRMVLLRIDSTACIGEFLLWQLYSDRVQDHFLLSANGSTVANVRLPILRTTPIWLASLDEQREIVAYLDEQTAKIDTLIAESELLIELSKERRGALITAAVTGQIDVRKMV